MAAANCTRVDPSLMVRSLVQFAAALFLMCGDPGKLCTDDAVFRRVRDRWLSISIGSSWREIYREGGLKDGSLLLQRYMEAERAQSGRQGSRTRLIKLFVCGAEPEQAAVIDYVAVQAAVFGFEGRTLRVKMANQSFQ